MAAPVTRHIAAGDLALAVHDWGGEGLPVLLVHATGFHGFVWAPIAARLAFAGRHVWSIDQRGHGGSDVPTVLAGWDDFATDVLTVADTLHLAGTGLVGVGHSAGAAALAMAEARVKGTFSKLWLYEPVILPVDPPPGATFPNPLADGARRRRNRFASVDEAIAIYGDKPPLNALRPDVLELYVRHGLVDDGAGALRLACPPEYEATVYELASYHHGYRMLADVSCPTVIATGEPGSPGSLADAGPALVQQLADGQLEVFPGLGHFGPLQDPDRIADAILHFVGD